MKILMFNTQPDEIEDFEAIADELNVQIDYINEALTLDNVDKTKDYDAITIQQHGALSGDSLYKRLAEMESNKYHYVVLDTKLSI